MNEGQILQELFASTGGGLIAGAIAWILFWCATKRNIQIENDRINHLETAARLCEEDRKDIHSKFHQFQTLVISNQDSIIKQLTQICEHDNIKS